MAKIAMTTKDRFKASFLVDALDMGEGIPAEVRRHPTKPGHWQVAVPDRIDSQVLRAAVRNFREDYPA